MRGFRNFMLLLKIFQMMSNRPWLTKSVVDVRN